MGLASEGQALRGGHGTAQEECKVLIEKPRLHSGGKKSGQTRSTRVRRHGEHTGAADAGTHRRYDARGEHARAQGLEERAVLLCHWVLHGQHAHGGVRAQLQPIQRVVSGRGGDGRVSGGGCQPAHGGAADQHAGAQRVPQRTRCGVHRTRRPLRLRPHAPGLRSSGARGHRRRPPAQHAGAGAGAAAAGDRGSERTVCPESRRRR